MISKRKGKLKMHSPIYGIRDINKTDINDLILDTHAAEYPDKTQISDETTIDVSLFLSQWEKTISYVTSPLIGWELTQLY